MKHPPFAMTCTGDHAQRDISFTLIIFLVASPLICAPEQRCLGIPLTVGANGLSCLNDLFKGVCHSSVEFRSSFLMYVGFDVCLGR